MQKALINPIRPVFERGDAKWIIVLQTITKQNINRVHTSTKLTPFQASLKKKKGFVYKLFLDKRTKMKSKFQVNDLVRTAVLRKTFSKGDTANGSHKL